MSEEDKLLKEICVNGCVSYGYLTIEPNEIDILLAHGLITAETDYSVKTEYRCTEKGREVYNHGGYDKYIERMTYEDMEHELKVVLMRLGISSLEDVKTRTKKAERNAKISRLLSYVSLFIAFAGLVLNFIKVLRG